MNLPSLMSASSARQRDKRLGGSYKLSVGDLAIMELPSDQDGLRLNQSLSVGRCKKVVSRLSVRKDEL